MNDVRGGARGPRTRGGKDEDTVVLDVGVDALDQFELTDRSAIVTGAASGIGRAIAIGLASAGADVAVLDINVQGAQETADAVEALGRRAMARRCDVTAEDDIVSGVAAVLDKLGSVDILVNNAGKSLHARPEATQLSDWRRVLDTNTTAYFLFAREVGRHMIKRGQGGAIVNISSISGSSALGRGNLVYSIAKAGINQLTRELAVEWAQHGIRINAIQPCQVLTPALERLIADPQFDSDALVAEFLRGIPLRRLAEPQDIVGPALFLSSPAASMVTGMLLPVDGGNLALNAGGTVASS